RYAGRGWTRGERRRIAEQHTDAEEVGRVFERVKPRLAVLSHYAPNANIVPLVRKAYAGPFELGEDAMTIDIGPSIRVERFTPASNAAGAAPGTSTSPGFD